MNNATASKVIPLHPPPPRRGQRVKLRLRISCSEPSPHAEAAWNEYLLKMLRKGMQQDS